jgi:hypothetical protein
MMKRSGILALALLAVITTGSAPNLLGERSAPRLERNVDGRSPDRVREDRLRPDNVIDGLTVRLPDKKTCDFAFVLKIRMRG